MATTEPKLEYRDEQPYVAIRREVTMQEIGPTLPPLIGELFGWLESKGIEPAGPVFWRYLVIDMEARLEIDVAIPVATTVIGEGDVISDVLPAGRYAVLLHTGPYDELMAVTAGLLAWAEKKGLVWDKWPAGSKGEAWRARIETYFTDPAEEPDPAKWETELAFKLADEQSQ